MNNSSYKSVFDALCNTRQESANMQLRADLMLHISQVIKAKGWTQKQASEYCGITQPRLNDLLNGKIDKFSLDALVNINASLGESISLNFVTA